MVLARCLERAAQQSAKHALLDRGGADTLHERRGIAFAGLSEVLGHLTLSAHGGLRSAFLGEAQSQTLREGMFGTLLDALVDGVHRGSFCRGGKAQFPRHLPSDVLGDHRVLDARGTRDGAQQTPQSDLVGVLTPIALGQLCTVLSRCGVYTRRGQLLLHHIVNRALGGTGHLCRAKRRGTRQSPEFGGVGCGSGSFGTTSDTFCTRGSTAGQYGCAYCRSHTTRERRQRSKRVLREIAQRRLGLLSEALGRRDVHGRVGLLVLLLLTLGDQRAERVFSLAQGLRHGVGSASDVSQGAYRADRALPKLKRHIPQRVSWVLVQLFDVVAARL